MDEPTSGLDPLIQQAFYDILKEENSRGATVFFSSHVLSEVQKLCDRVAILKEGQLIGIQSIKELRESGYKKVSLSAKEAIPRDFFDLSGIANYAETADKTSVSFMYNGNITAIIDKLHLLHLGRCAFGRALFGGNLHALLCVRRCRGMVIFEI